MITNQEKIQAIHEILKNPPQPKNPNEKNRKHYKNINEWVKQNIKQPKIQFNLKLHMPKQQKYKYDINDKKLDYPNPFEAMYENKQQTLKETKNILNNPITLHEINTAIKEIDPSKAMGPDSIHNKMLINTGPNVRKILQIIFNRSLITATIPSEWEIDVITPIPKPNRDHTNPKNYRPIAISSIIGRLMQKIIAKRLQHFAYITGIFKANQSGFQINRSCIDAIVPLYQTILCNLDIQSATQLLQTDFAKAYDTVWHNGLIYKLNKVGITGTLLTWLNKFIKTRRTTVQYDTQQSPLSKQEIGLPQGSPLSPILYIIYTNDYKLSPLGYKYLYRGCFADDTIFWNKPCPKSFFDKYIPKIMSLEYQNFQQWCTKWKLVISPEKNKWTKFENAPIKINEKNSNKLNIAHIYKCNMVTQEDIDQYHELQKQKIQSQITLEQQIKITKTPNLSQKEKQILQNTNMPITPLEENTKYLGMWLDKYLTLKRHKNHIISSTYYQLINLKKILYKKLPINLNTLQTIYNSKARSRIEYGLIIHSTPQTLKTYQTIQNKFLRLMLNTPKTTPIELLHFIIQTPYIKDRYYYYSGKHYIKTQYVPFNHPLTEYKNTYQNYKEIIEEKEIWEILKIKKPHWKATKTYNKHPIKIGFDILKIINHPIMKSASKTGKFKQPLTALPINEILKPNIIKINKIGIKKDIIMPQKWAIFNTDASAILNPGIGAGYWSCTQNPNLINPIYVPQKFPIPYEINLYELRTLHSILTYLINNPELITNYILIKCDSENTIDWISGYSTPKAYIIQNEIQMIYFKIHYLKDRYKIKIIRIQKVKAHSQSEQHNKVDILARNLATEQTYNPNLNHYLPYYIQISYLKQYIYKNRNKQWEKYRKQYNNKKQEKRPIIEVFNNNTYTIKNRLNKILTHTDRGIIIRLMCKETPTNEFLKKYLFYKTPHNNGLCEYCQEEKKKDIKETAHHIIFECPQYANKRSIMKNKMAKISKALVYKKNWNNINNILFPWKNNKIIPKHTTDKITIQIWKLLIQYLKRTKNKAFDPNQLIIIQ